MQPVTLIEDPMPWKASVEVMVRLPFTSKIPAFSGITSTSVPTSPDETYCPLTQEKATGAGRAHDGPEAKGAEEGVEGDPLGFCAGIVEISVNESTGGE